MKWPAIALALLIPNVTLSLELHLKAQASPAAQSDALPRRGGSGNHRAKLV